MGARREPSRYSPGNEIPCRRVGPRLGISFARRYANLHPPLMSSTTYDRRAFMAYFGSIGLGTTLLPGVLWAQAAQQQGATITTEQIAAAEEVAGLQFSEEERKAMAEGLGRARNDL